MKQAHPPLVLLASTLPSALSLLSPRAALQSIALDIPVPLATDKAQQGPEVPVTRFTRRVWGGSGCPPGQSLDEDRTQAFRVATDGVLAYDFTDLYAYTGSAWNDGQPSMNADCMVLVSITDIPPGWNFRVTSMRARGYSSLMAVTSARIGAALSLGDGMGLFDAANLAPSGQDPVSSLFDIPLLDLSAAGQVAPESRCITTGPSHATLNLTLSLSVVSAANPVEWGLIDLEAVELGGLLWPCAG